MVRLNTVWSVYEYINKKKGITPEAIGSQFGFSIKKVKKIIKKLISGGLIFEKDNGYYPVSWKAFIKGNNGNMEA